MNLDDELRALFADKSAFDVPVADDAARTVLAAARRARRRRRTVSGAAGAVTVAAVIGAGIAASSLGGPASLPPADPSLTVAGTTTTTPTSHVTVPRGSGQSIATGQLDPAPHSVTVRRPPDPTTTPPPAQPLPPADPMAFGPSGFDGLTLGMTAEQAEATGVITPNAAPVLASGCKGYNYTGMPRPAYEYSVIISDKYGVVRIAALGNGVTPEGIFLGVTEEKVRSTYPAATGTPGAEWDAGVPGNPQARYRFLVDSGKVWQMRLELAEQDCFS